MIEISVRTSKFASLLKKIFAVYCFIEGWLYTIYKNSKIHRLISSFWATTKASFEYCFLGRIAEIKVNDYSVILNNSNFMRWLSNKYNILKHIITKNSKSSTIIISIKETKKELYFLPIKTCGIIVVTSILINTALTILLKQKLGLSNWTIRILFLSIGLGGLFCDADWETIKSTSKVFNKISTR